MSIYLLDLNRLDLQMTCATKNLCDDVGAQDVHMEFQQHVGETILLVMRTGSRALHSQTQKVMQMAFPFDAFMLRRSRKHRKLTESNAFLQKDWKHHIFLSGPGCPSERCSAVLPGLQALNEIRLCGYSLR